ncbi:CoA-binding protein [Methanosalsum natronophilum]|uniref:CoA-binding protein n=1 Tax=Methanosalsum natronophilum TaxID=768733 RepID=UPI0035B5C52D|nr:putative CoA-binding protein [Methanosalsum natronophilum]
MSEIEEKFLEKDTFLIITDQTKPAIKTTVKTLKEAGKKVYVADVSGKPIDADFKKIAEIPVGFENVIIGIKYTDPGFLIKPLEEKGAKKIWIHWRTTTKKVKEVCQESNVQCIMGKCPMMYLGKDYSIHGLHRSIAKLLGKY